MPSTLRTAVARVVGARSELRSESASLLAPGRARQRVRDSPQSFTNLAAAKIQRFVLTKGAPNLAKMLFRLPDAARVIENPSPAEVKALAAKMPTARET